MTKKLFRPELFEQTDGELRVIASRCRHCGAISYPANELCVFCLREDMEKTALDTRGELYSYTVTRRPVDKWQAPHAIGIVRIPSQQVSLVAPLMMEDGREDFQVGEAMDMVIAKYWDEGEDEVFGYKFRRAAKEDSHA